jgi:hypothetical protein
MVAIQLLKTSLLVIAQGVALGQFLFWRIYTLQLMDGDRLRVPSIIASNVRNHTGNSAAVTVAAGQLLLHPATVSQIGLIA